MLSRNSLRTFSTSVPRSVKISSVPASSSLVSSLKVIVKNAGSKDGPTGLPHLLAASTFLDTPAKSGLRLKRESELLGGEYSAKITRDALVLEASFLKDSLPYFVNALGNALTDASYKPHEFTEISVPYASHVNQKKNSCPKFKALEELHAVSFRNGLGKPLYFDGTKQFSSEDVSKFAKSNILSENIEIIADNVDEADLSKFVSESSFSKIPTGNDIIAAPQKTYAGKESRIRQAGKSSATIGLPIDVKDISKFELIAAGLVSKAPETVTSSIDAQVLPYNEGALFYFSVTSECPKEVSTLISSAAKTLKSSHDYSAYKSFAAYLNGKPVEISESTLSVPNFNYVVVGDVDSIPLYSEL